MFSLASPQETRTYEGCLFTHGRDDHNDLTNRAIEIFRWFLTDENKDFTHLFMLDDDCYVVAERLAGLPWEKSDVLGHKSDWYYSGGPGACLSKRMVEKVLYYMSRDDCVIGALLSVIDMSHFKTRDVGNDFHPWKEAPWPSPTNDVVVQHYIRTPQEMLEIDKDMKP